jgi:hypothetical protein
VLAARPYIGASTNSNRILLALASILPGRRSNASGTGNRNPIFNLGIYSAYFFGDLMPDNCRLTSYFRFAGRTLAGCLFFRFWLLNPGTWSTFSAKVLQK